MMLRVFPAATGAQIATARELLLEYARRLGFDLSYQNFDEELRTFPGKYVPPGGRLLLAEWNHATAGMIAMRPLEEKAVCEMKRLFVRPEFRGKNIGRSLAEVLIEESRRAGYHRMRLDTVSGKMESAITLYRDLGFVEVPAYYKSMQPGTIYMELDLSTNPP